MYFQGVKYSSLAAILNFMYNGEVSVAQDELTSFLNVAEDLRVKGLIQGQDSERYLLCLHFVCSLCMTVGMMT